MSAPPPKNTRRRRAHRIAVTLLDVAQAAEVSTASASRALARPGLVSEPVRDRVLSAATRLGYVPNAAARALSARRSGLVGVIADSLEDVVARRAIDALGRRLAAAGYGLLVATGGGDAKDTLRGARELFEHGADALAFVGVTLPRDITELRSGDPPRPLACIDQIAAGALAAGFDRARAMELAIRYLRDLGHRRIGVAAPGRTCRVSSLRGVFAGDVMLVETGLPGLREEAPLVAEALRTLLVLPELPSALVCGSDALAAMFVRECTLEGVSVPGQLSVVGFGDTELARQVKPALTTLRVPAREAGIAAADLLLANLRGEVATAVDLAAKMVARDSTGRPIK